MDSTLPIIRLELDQMKHTLCIALTEYTACLDAELQTAIERFCIPENLRQIIETTTSRMLTQIITEEVESWFRHGTARAIIKQAIITRLEQEFFSE